MSGNRKKIMIVDDNMAVLQMGKEFLRDTYEVYPLPSAEKMFEALKKVTPDLFLLDIKMPDTDGYEIIKRIKADYRYAMTPVIFLSGSYAVEDAVEGFRLGAADYITKPFRNPEFIDCIKKHLDAAVVSESLETDDENDDRPVVLAVDDSPDILKMIHLVLRDVYKVYTLPKPEKLGELLKTVTPDLFLLDYRMPSMSGFDLIPVIRIFPQHKDTPIIFLTSDGSVDSVTSAVGLGACDYIRKPFKKEVLRERIARHL